MPGRPRCWPPRRCRSGDAGTADPGVGIGQHQHAQPRLRPVAQAIAPGDEVDRREVGRARRPPGRPSATCAPVTVTAPKKRPSRASGAAWCRIDPQPDCESEPLIASRAPRKSASAAPRVVRAHHDRAAIPARRAARQPVVGARRPPRPGRRAPGPAAGRRSGRAPAADASSPPTSRRSRDSASGAATPRRPQPVADRRPEPVMAPRASGQSYIGSATATAVAHRRCPAPARSRSDAPPDPCG